MLLCEKVDRTFSVGHLERALAHTAAKKTNCAVCCTRNPSGEFKPMAPRQGRERILPPNVLFAVRGQRHKRSLRKMGVIQVWDLILSVHRYCSLRAEETTLRLIPKRVTLLLQRSAGFVLHSRRYSCRRTRTADQGWRQVRSHNVAERSWDLWHSCSSRCYTPAIREVHLPGEPIRTVRQCSRSHPFDAQAA